MTSAIQRRRGTAAEHAAFTGLAGELTVDTTDNRLVVHDGSTAGGVPMAKESELAAKAPLASPTFTGVPVAPTAAPGTDTTQIATTAFVQAAAAALVDSSPAALDTLNELAAALGDDAAFATTVTNALAAKAPLLSPVLTGTPTAPTAAAATSTTQIASTAFVQQELASAGVGTAQTRNRLVNPAFQISQENGNTAGTTTGYYLADQWAKYHVSSAGTLTAQRVQSVTPNGSKDRARITITAADASLAAGEYLFIRQEVIGQEVADLMWGSATAVDIVVRFGFKGPQGTYAVKLGNAAANRSYVTLFTIGAGAADTDTEQTVVIPGDTTGTWLKDTGIGLTLNIVLAAGSTFQTTADAWQAGNFLGTAGVSNGMATINDVFEIFDVGVYADPEDTGVAPTWEMPSDNAVFAAEGRGHVVQSKVGTYVANADLTTAVPIDDTIPQSTEGTEIITVSITPRSTTNRLRVTFSGQVTATAAATAVIALFRDAGGGAIAAVPKIIAGANSSEIAHLIHEFTPGSVAPTTLKIRVGGNATLRMNGTSVSRLFGGVAAAYLVVEEIKQ